MEAIIPAKQYEMLELGFIGPEPAGSQVQVDLCGRFTRGEQTWTVPGFYAGNGTYRLRFLPEEAGEYGLTVTGKCSQTTLRQLQAKLNGEDLLTKTPREMRQVRGKKISMIFQDPMTARTRPGGGDPSAPRRRDLVPRLRHHGLRHGPPEPGSDGGDLPEPGKRPL